MIDPVARVRHVIYVITKQNGGRSLADQLNFVHTGGIPHGTKASSPYFSLPYQKQFALFHVRFKETQTCVGFPSTSAELWGSLTLKILLDEITLETYDRLRNTLKNYLLVYVAEFV